jgi:hypothetical protein
MEALGRSCIVPVATLGVGLVWAMACGRTEMGVSVQGADSGAGGSGGAGGSVPTGTGGADASAGGADGMASGPCGAATCLASLFQTCVPEGRCSVHGGSSPSAAFSTICYANGVTVSYQGSGTGSGSSRDLTVRRNGVLCYLVKGWAPANASGYTYSIAGPGGEVVATGATADKAGSITVTCKDTKSTTVSYACLFPDRDTSSCDLDTCP